MLLWSITIISFVITATVYVVDLVSKLYFIPVVFCASFIGLFALWALSCIICTMLVDKSKPCEKANRIYRFYANCIIDTLTQVLRVKLHITGMDILPNERFLLVGNHRSSMDPILEMGALRNHNIGFVAKQELFKIPVIGKIMHKCFCLSLNRGDPREDVKAIMQAVKLIKNQTASIGIYPEGKRNHKNVLLPFKNGAFKIAQKAKCPMVVASIRNSDEIMKNAPFRRTHVYIDFIQVLDADFVSENSTAAIGERVKNILENHINQENI